MDSVNDNGSLRDSDLPDETGPTWSVAELEYNTWDDACAWEFRNAPVNILPGLIHNPPTDIIQNYETDDNSDTDSVAELEYNTWDDACAWEFRNAPVNIPPGLIQNPPTDIIRNYTDDDEYPEKFGRGGCVDSSIHPPWICLGQHHCRGGGGAVRYRTMPICLSEDRILN